MVDVLIAGVPRSGTTWVGRVLGGTADCDYVHEPDNERLWSRAAYAKRGLGRFPWVTEHQDEDLAAYAQLWTEAFGSSSTRVLNVIDRLYRGTGLGEAAASGHVPPLIGIFGRAARTAMVGRRVGNRVVKTVHAARSLEFAAQTTGAQVLVVRRHPLNVLASWVEMDLPDADRALDGVAPVRELPIRPPCSAGRMERAVWQLSLLEYHLETALRRNPTWLEVKHEDLVVDPPEAFRSLALEIGLTWRDQDAGRVRGTNKSGAGFDAHRTWAEVPQRWARTFSQEESEKVLRLLSSYGERGRDLG